jgi:FAD synthetase
MKKVLAGGTFSILHPGHAYFLSRAKALGDYLVVVVASDSTVKSSKGTLLAPARDRKVLIESLSCVDKAVIGGEGDFFSVVEEESPDVIALGYDQDRKWLDMALESSGLRPKVARIGELKGYSTSRIIGRMSGK